MIVDPWGVVLAQAPDAETFVDRRASTSSGSREVRRIAAVARQPPQRPAVAARLRQAESHVGEFAGFRDGKSNLHRVAAFHVTLLVSGIKRRLERDVEVETLFFRIVNTTRDSKGHNGNGIFITLRGNWATCEER